jgi:hypothetical protein
LYLIRQTLTYAFPEAELDVEIENTEGHSGSAALPDDGRDRVHPKPQNQVAIILVCELNQPSSDPQGSPPQLAPLPPPIVVATTHLKATKDIRGERSRYLEAKQLLKQVDHVVKSLTDAKREPAVVITVSSSSYYKVN